MSTNTKVVEDLASQRAAEDTEWHETKREKNTDEMSHLVDAEALRHFDSKHKTFVDDPKNLRLAIITDGFNPFGNFSSTYSMWPILVTPLNLPPWECVNPSNCFMSLLILSPTSLGKDFDLFLEPLIDELLELWKGVKTFHVLLPHEDFTLSATVLWCILSTSSLISYKYCPHYLYYVQYFNLSMYKSSTYVICFIVLSFYNVI